MRHVLASATALTLGLLAPRDGYADPAADLGFARTIGSPPPSPDPTTGPLARRATRPSSCCTSFTPDAPAPQRRSTPMLIGGLVLSVVGGGAVAGGALFNRGVDEDTRACWARTTGTTVFAPCGLNDTAKIFGYGLMAGGLTFVAHGIPLTILGAMPAEAPEHDRRVPPASAVPEITLGSSGGSARWTF